MRTAVECCLAVEDSLPAVGVEDSLPGVAVENCFPGVAVEDCLPGVAVEEAACHSSLEACIYNRNAQKRIALCKD